MTTINRDHFEQYIEENYNLPVAKLVKLRAVDADGLEGYDGTGSDVSDSALNGMWFTWKAAKEDNWKTVGDVEYDRNIHSNPDHTAWAKFFVETFDRCGIDEDTIAGWFANAMMARHDYDREQNEADEVIKYLVEALDCYADGTYDGVGVAQEALKEYKRYAGRES